MQAKEQIDIGRARRVLQWAALSAALASGTLLSGCAWTIVSAADAIGSVTQAGVAIASQTSSPTYVTGQPVQIKHVCIEINNQVNLEDLVPALRVALASRGVTTMVYNAGNAPPDCEARLTYTASMDYGHREFADGYSRYLSVIDLRLTHGNEIVVAHYQTEGLNLDRFATTSTKMRGLVRRMVLPVQETQMAAVPISRSSGYTLSTNGSATYSTAEVSVVPVQNPPINTTTAPQYPNGNTSGNVYGSAPDPGSQAYQGYPSPYANGPAAAPAPAYRQPNPYANTAAMPAPATAPPVNAPNAYQPPAWKPQGVTSTSP